MIKITLSESDAYGTGTETVLLSNNSYLDVIRSVITGLPADQMLAHYDEFLQAGMTADEMLACTSDCSVREVEFLVRLAAEVEDVGLLFTRSNCCNLAPVLGVLVGRGYEIDAMVSEMMFPGQVRDNLLTLLELGVDVNLIMRRLTDEMVEEKIETLLEAGADANDLSERLSKQTIKDNFGLLVGYSAYPNLLLEQVGYAPEWYRSVGIEYLLSLGADPKIVTRNAIYRYCPDIKEVLTPILKYDYRADRVLEATAHDMSTRWFLITEYRLLKEYGADFDLNRAIAECTFILEDVLGNLELIQSYGIEPDIDKYAKTVAKRYRKKGYKVSYRELIAMCE